MTVKLDKNDYIDLFTNINTSGTIIRGAYFTDYEY